MTAGIAIQLAEYDDDEPAVRLTVTAEDGTIVTVEYDWQNAYLLATRIRQKARAIEVRLSTFFEARTLGKPHLIRKGAPKALCGATIIEEMRNDPEPFRGHYGYQLCKRCQQIHVGIIAKDSAQ